MIRNPMVSVITPSLNQGEFIEHSITSVLNQSYRPIEHIIVDGGSTDNTLDVLRAYRASHNLIWISEPDHGQTDALMKGFRLAHGDIFGWLNSDDVYFDKHAVSLVVNRFLTQPDVDVVYGDDALIDRANRVLRIERILEWDYAKLQRGLCISQPATFLRKEVVLQNPLNVDLQYSMDLEYWLRLGRVYRFEHLRSVLAACRVHDRQKRTAMADAAKQEDIAILRKYGQRFGLKFLVLRYISDLPGLALRRFQGFLESLSLQNRANDLAFDGPPVSKAQLLLAQLRPVR